MLGRLHRDVGIDLGTANTVIYIRGKGIVLNEPSVVAIDQNTKQVLAVGEEAKRMVGRTPGSIQAIRPLKDGVIADFDMTEAMLRSFIMKVNQRRSILRPRAVIAVPSGVTEVEKRAVVDAAISAGFKDARLIEEPMAAAIGAGLDVQEPHGNMVVDIGGGTCEVAVISLGGIVTHESIRIGGDDMDEAIVQYVRRAYNVLIGERTAEEVKIAIGSVSPQDAPAATCEVRGRDLVTGLPRTLTLTSEEIAQSLADPVHAILEGIRRNLERTPPELAADIYERGIVLAGGGALLHGIDRLIAEETGIPVHICDDPLGAVARGTGIALENYDLMQRVLVAPRKLAIS